MPSPSPSQLDGAIVTSGGTVAPSNVLVVGGRTADGTPQYWPIPLAAGGSSVFISDPDTVSVGNVVSLTNTTNAASIALSGDGVVGIQVSNWAAGTGLAPALAIEATTDGTNWFAVNGVASVTGAQVTSITGNGQWRVNAAGYQSVRVRSTVAAASASATVALVANTNSPIVTLAEPLPAGTSLIGSVAAYLADPSGTGRAAVLAADPPPTAFGVFVRNAEFAKLTTLLGQLLDAVTELSTFFHIKG